MTYEGKRPQTFFPASVYRITDAGERIPLEPRFDLANHSPTGFEWGYGGSGPAQLALAILADHLRDDERALRLYQMFKAKVIAVIDQSEWQMTSEFIERVVMALENSMKN